jgi:AraC-like DNA-binding protein
MVLKFYNPPDKLLPFDSIRLAYSTSTKQRIVTTPPFGKPALILFLNPDSVKNYSHTSQGILLGQHTQPLMLNLNENYKVLALHLKPYALKQLFNLDASQLTNKYRDIKGMELLEKLYESVKQNMDDETQLIDEINKFWSSVALYPVSYEVTAFLTHLQLNQASSIYQMTKEIGLTERNLERKFKAEVGLSPKKYLQIRRVFQVFETLKEDTDWQQLVVNHNYTDQSHLINEFKKYAKIAPGLYVRKGLTIAGQHPYISYLEH